MGFKTVATIIVMAVALLGCSMTKKPEKPPTFGFVLLQELNIPTHEAMLSALKECLSPDLAITGLSIDDKAVSFKVEEQSVMFAYLDCPIPWGDLEGPCATTCSVAGGHRTGEESQCSPARHPGEGKGVSH